ncbi:MAG: TRAP transporter substrate-binding protein [Gammaproteobacteria bacterium]
MLKTLVQWLLAACFALSAQGQAADITLKFHHMLPPTSTAHKQLIEPWAREVEAASQGRIKVEIYPAMQLGGKPPQLYDQARDGIADLVWTLPGYTPGRFPQVEVFELPFVTASAEATSQAVQAFYEKHLQQEFAEVHPLFFHVHAPGSLHLRGKPVATLEDMQGLKIRAPTRISNSILKALGATPVGMPVPQIPEALSKGVVDGAVIPYEITRPLKIHELTDSHTEFKGERGLYTSVFIVAMNKAKYDALPDDLKKIIDAHSGMAWAKRAGQAWDAAEAPGRQAAADAKAAFQIIQGQELARWQTATAPVITEWLKDMQAKNIDGKTLLDDARALVAQYAGQ